MSVGLPKGSCRFPSSNFKMTLFHVPHFLYFPSSRTKTLGSFCGSHRTVSHVSYFMLIFHIPNFIWGICHVPTWLLRELYSISRPLQLSNYFVQLFHDLCHVSEVWLPTCYICAFWNSAKVIVQAKLEFNEFQKALLQPRVATIVTFHLIVIGLQYM